MEHASDAPAYGLWSLVVINSLVFVIFAFGDAYRQYKNRVPAFFPKLGADRAVSQP
jgi:protein-S-isoprenylcysteine O-methyltransferase Ste14